MQKFYLQVQQAESHFLASDFMKQAIAQKVHLQSENTDFCTQLITDAGNYLRKLAGIPAAYQLSFFTSEATLFSALSQAFPKGAHLLNSPISHRLFANQAQQSAQVDAYHWRYEQNFDLQQWAYAQVDRPLYFSLNDSQTGHSFPLIVLEGLGAKLPYVLDLTDCMPFRRVFVKVSPLAFWADLSDSFGLPLPLYVLGTKTTCVHTNCAPLHTWVAQKIFEDLVCLGHDQLNKATVFKSVLLKEAFKSSQRFSPLVGQTAFQSETTLVFQGKRQDVLDLKVRFDAAGYVLPTFAHDTLGQIANFAALSKERVQILADLICM